MGFIAIVETDGDIIVVPGSGGAGVADAQICWLGHPSHAATLPASSLPVPGQSEYHKNDT